MSKLNKAIIACAGAGKTYSICKSALDLQKESLIITYTNFGKSNIIRQIKELNDGVLSNHVRIMTWFHFLMYEIIKPYQTDYLRAEASIFPAPLNYFQEIDFSTTHQRNYNIKNTLKYFTSGNHKLRHNETVVLANYLLGNSNKKVIRRLHQQFDSIYFDEVQDLIGTDIDFVKKLIESPIRIVMVGDPKQFTYSTHYESKNKQRSGANISVFFNELLRENKIEIEYKQVTRRFGVKIAELANSVDPSGQLLSGSNESNPERINSILLVSKKDIDLYCQLYQPQLLIMDKNSLKKLPQRHSRTINFGESKGMTFDHTLIVPNGPLDKFLKKGTPLQSPVKYYIAVTRAKYSVAFLVENPLKYTELHPDWFVWNPKELN